MKALLFALLPLIGLVIGYYLGGRNRPAPKLTRPEREELAVLRHFKASVRSVAASNYELEPNLNRIYMDEVDKADKEIDNVR